VRDLNILMLVEQRLRDQLVAMAMMRVLLATHDRRLIFRSYLNKLLNACFIELLLGNLLITWSISIVASRVPRLAAERVSQVSVIDS
jgi:hypothetical protein